MPCSLQSLNCMAESDRPLKWCVRPFFLSGCQPHHVWLYCCQTSLYCSYTATAGAHDRKKDKPPLPHREREGKWRKADREREGERKECCVIYHGLVSSGLPPSLQASIKCETEKIKCGPKKKEQKNKNKQKDTHGRHRNLQSDDSDTWWDKENVVVINALW